jgi:hypothetical protein
MVLEENMHKRHVCRVHCGHGCVNLERDCIKRRTNFLECALDGEGVGVINKLGK